MQDLQWFIVSRRSTMTTFTTLIYWYGSCIESKCLYPLVSGTSGCLMLLFYCLFIPYWLYVRRCHYLNQHSQLASAAHYDLYSNNSSQVVDYSIHRFVLVSDDTSVTCGPHRLTCPHVLLNSAVSAGSSCRVFIISIIGVCFAFELFMNFLLQVSYKQTCWYHSRLLYH